MRRFAFYAAASLFHCALWSLSLGTVPAAGHGQATEKQLGAGPWRSIKDFSVPHDGVGDPDGILSATGRQSLADRLMSINDVQAARGSNAETSTTEGGSRDVVVPIQIAIAVVERLARDSSVNYDESTADIDGIVEQFAMNLHDEWGVGHETAQGGTGVLIFLDVYDRVVYISRGGALAGILTNSRMDSVIHNMKDSLRQAKYADGLALAVDSVAELIEKGEPRFWEKFTDLFRFENIFLLGWLFIFGNGLVQIWRQRRDQISYARAASQLSELDRAHAEALQGNFQATSCPICLEIFPSTTEGSDGQPIKLLRCGHVFDESCWAEWVSSGRGDVTKCPICRMDIGPASHGGEQIGREIQMAADHSLSEAPTAELSPDAGTDLNHDNNESETLLRNRRNASGGNMVLTTNNNSENQHTNANSIVHGDPDRAMRLYQRERNFRLLRLAQMYPRYISPTHMSRWTSSTYNGSLVQDPSFVDSNPARSMYNDGSRVTSGQYGHSRGGGFGGGGITFGGGSSAGGRSGRF